MLKLINKIIDRINFIEFFAVLFMIFMAVMAGFAMKSGNSNILDGIMTIINMAMGAIIAMFYRGKKDNENQEGQK